MKAILMAAGVGSRISNKISGPKCTLKINTPNGEMPLVRYTVERLLSRGITVAIVTGYLEKYVHEALEGLDVQYYSNPFYKVTNSMASLWFAREFLADEDTILMNADVFWTDEIMDSITSSDKKYTMLGDVTRADTGDYFFGLKDNKIVRYGKELVREERDTEYVGIALIKKEGIENFRERLETMVQNGRYDLWWENVLYEYCDTDPVYVVDSDGHFWAEVDYFEDYMRIMEYTNK